MRMKPLFPKKENGGKTAAPKKEKPTVDEQIMETGVRLRGLQRKYRIIIDRELRALRGSRGRGAGGSWRSRPALRGWRIRIWPLKLCSRLPRPAASA